MSEISFSGIASGIDTEAIIKATLEAKRIANVPTENRKVQAENENTALGELNTLLLNLRSSLEGFLSVEGSAVSKTATSSKPDAVKATASQAAQVGSVSVRVDQLASAGTLSFINRFDSTADPIAPGLSGTETLSLQVGEKTIELSVNNQTSLANLVDQISEKGQGLVSAGIVNGGTSENPQYLLMLNSTKSGTKEGSLNLTLPPSLEAALGGINLEQAKDASLFVTGVGQITRSSNTITDVVPGVTLELTDVTTSSTQINISNDVNVTAAKMEEFVAAYNELLTYSRDNSAVESVETENGVSNEFGSLSRTRLDEQAIRDIRRGISSARSTIQGSEVAIMADLGLTTNRDGTLKFDKDVFTKATNNDSASADSLLRAMADKLATTSGTISEYTKFSGLIDFAKKSNESRISSINDRLRRVEENLAKQEDDLRRLFAKFEANVGELNSQSSQLLSLLQF